jgi:pantoate--beta-alanine ligase
MSSRNRYLYADLRRRALAIPEGLRRAQRAFAAGERRGSVLTELVRAPISDRFDQIDYVACADPETLAPIHEETGPRAVLLVAARLASKPGIEPGVRLIDNTVLGEDNAP